jgi:transcriptional regulator with XRE-family HTH domain
MNAGTLVRTARLRQGLTQRELARRSRVSQPMISSIERGLQDPRYGTLERILAAIEHEVDLIPRAGVGVDRTQFIATLRLTPDERMKLGARGTRWLTKLRKAGQDHSSRRRR